MVEMYAEYVGELMREGMIRIKRRSVFILRGYGGLPPCRRLLRRRLLCATRKYGRR